MSNILLDYIMPIVAIEPTPAASSGFLRKVLAVVKPKNGVTPGTIATVTTQSQIAALTDNLDVQQLLAGGLTSVFVLPVAGLDDIAAALPGHEGDFFTVLISSDFVDADLADLDLGTSFEGVVGVSSVDDDFLEEQAAIPNRAAFHTTVTNKAKNMFFAFGKLLANPSRWRNQQYISVPATDDVNTLGEANLLFEKRISFAMSDSEFGQRLGLFAAGGKAIAAPYILKNFQLDLQSEALGYIASNQPPFTKKEAALIESQLQKVRDTYVERQEIEAGTVEVKLEGSNFVAVGMINVAEPGALWRIFSEMKQTL